MTQLTAPADGQIHKDWGTYIRNAQPIGNDVFLVETNASKTGSGKVWRPGVIYPDPRRPGQWEFFGSVKPAMMSYRRGQFKATLWGYDTDNKNRYVEGFFPTELLAVQFLVRNATEFFKP